MGHFKEQRNRVYKLKNVNWGGEPPFRANLRFGYAQSGYERTFFSESIVMLLRKSQKIVRTKIVHTSVHFSKNIENIFKFCSLYRKSHPIR